MQSALPPSPDDSLREKPYKERDWKVVLLCIIPILLVLLVLLYMLPPWQTDDKNNPLSRIGQPLPDFTLPDLQGRMVQLSTLRGKVVFINVWATWCKPCIDEMPTIQRLYNRLHERGLEVLAVSIDSQGALIVAPFMRDHQLTFRALFDPKSTIQRLYGSTMVPTSFIVDKNGLLVETILGAREWDNSQMLVRFERLLAAPEMLQGRRDS